MALEFGSGTQADPYLLVNLADVTAWLTTKQTQGFWFALVADLDVTATSISLQYSNWKWNLDGRGYKISVKLNRISSGYSLIGGIDGCVIKRAWFYLSTSNGVFADGTVSSVISLNDAIFEANKAFSAPAKTIFGGNKGIINEAGTALGVHSTALSIYKNGPAVANTTNTASFADGNPYNRNNYPTFAEENWVFDGISLPRPRHQTTADLTNRYAVKGQSKVGGNGRQRNLAVFTENGLRYKVQDTKADGSFFLNLNDVSTPVIVMAYDDIGAKAAINTAYSLNQIIHPAIPNGFRYRCTLAGNSGATIPSEPWPTSAVLTIGAAKFTPEPVYEPKAHGPLLPVLFNVVTEQPV